MRGFIALQSIVSAAHRVALLISVSSLLLVCFAWRRTLARTEGIGGALASFGITVELRHNLIWVEWVRPDGNLDLAQQILRRGFRRYRQEGQLANGGVESRLLYVSCVSKDPIPQYGFAAARLVCHQTGVVFHVYCAPFWAVTACLAFVGGFEIWVLLKERAFLRHRTSTLCSFCGYNLRASRGRCPECGAAALRPQQ
jgi:hypothetical protein